MNLTPLIQASPIILIHTVPATIAILVGLLQFAGRKGVATHRVLGWIWVCAMMVLAVSSFWINEIRLWGDFSPIHVLSIITIINVPLAVLAARRHKVAKHKKEMILLYVLALGVAGIFTFSPGRILYRVFMG